MTQRRGRCGLYTPGARFHWQQSRAERKCVKHAHSQEGPVLTGHIAGILVKEGSLLGGTSSVTANAGLFLHSCVNSKQRERAGDTEMNKSACHQGVGGAREPSLVAQQGRGQRLREVWRGAAHGGLRSFLFSQGWKEATARLGHTAPRLLRAERSVSAGLPSFHLPAAGLTKAEGSVLASSGPGDPAANWQGVALRVEGLSLCEMDFSLAQVRCPAPQS